jgi:lipopolysaccharide assembly outer membrane protein LptD (OstA)
MTRVVAGGDVSLNRADTTMRAGRAEVWINARRAIASGDVTLVRADLTVRAPRVEAQNIGATNGVKILGSGGVSAKNGEGAVRASRVEWGGGRVVATGGVELVKDGNTVRAARLDSDDKFREAKLSGNIGGNLAGGGALSAGSVVWRAGGNGGGRIIAHDGVSARRGALALRADKLDASGDGAHATLTGNVVVTSDKGATVRAPLVRYDRAAAKVYASGGVTFRDPQSGMEQRGKTLVADLNLQQATMTDVSGSGRTNLLQDKKLFGD